MVKFLIAPDKFKGSLGARDVGKAIAAGIRDVEACAEIAIMPIADGGEGTADVICGAAEGEWHACEVRDPLGRIVTARYCTIDDGATAVMEMSEASGMWRIAPGDRDIALASTFGTGQTLLDATRRGVREIIIGLGGSATNDGGFGMARALGFRFVGSRERELHGSVLELSELERIETPVDLWLPAITAAVDVRNPLLGASGATRIFATQKGARAEELDLLERALARLADIAARDLGANYRDAAGAGAAGGLGFGLMTFCGARLRSGFDVVAERIGLAEAVRNSDIVITGEGRLDSQTAQGKAPAGVAKLARAAGKKVFAIVGSAEDDESARALFDNVWPLARAPIT
ncbi:MAG TPA: glycerate kinase, partial [Chthoniobacterales bacterium]